MPTNYDPNFAPTAVLAVVVSASVSTSASAAAARLGPFRGIYIQTSTDFTVMQEDDTTIGFVDAPKGATIWLAGKYITAIATATAVIALK